MYGALLNQPAGPGVGAPPPGAAPPLPPPPPGAAQGVGLGAPPKMPGMPPPPTNIGAMPVGDPSTDKKAAVDGAVLALRELKGHFPSLGTTLDSTIDQIKSVAKGGGGAPKPALGEPIPSGADVGANPIPGSGSKGGF